MMDSELTRVVGKYKHNGGGGGRKEAEVMHEIAYQRQVTTYNYNLN